MPSAVSVVIAGSPAAVAGTLTITFGRPTSRCRRRASSIVPAVSPASRGLTSMLARPSSPCVRACTGASRSQTRRISSTASDSNSTGPERPSAAPRAIASS